MAAYVPEVPKTDSPGTYDRVFQVSWLLHVAAYLPKVPEPRSPGTCYICIRIAGYRPFP